MRRELMTFAEQTLQIFLGDVTVTGRNVHHKTRRAILRRLTVLHRNRPAPPDGIANQPFHDLPI
jgi:hypothetical protein